MRFDLTPVRAMFILLALWPASQIAFLIFIFAFSSAPPTNSAELLFKDLNYQIASAVLAGIVTVIFGLEAAIRVWRRVVDRSSPNLKIGYGFLHILGVFMLLLVLVYGYLLPGKEVFVDFPTETIFTRTTQLLPPGVRQQRIEFGEITAIVGFFRPVPGGNHYVVEAATRGGVRIVLVETQWVDSDEPPAELTELARTIAEKSGARLVLR